MPANNYNTGTTAALMVLAQRQTRLWQRRREGNARRGRRGCSLSRERTTHRNSVCALILRTNKQAQTGEEHSN